ncbi:unnamed protein product [Heligmosomoides polygyrus]|uniref:G_PROTEIN_RECEP_F1_2 domain-containing protein n=1 Tax=Heligmosomoides polygyrus TaxID=6339 RepID=A0A183FZK3_HELPZ|nr:unnamed protein product [Heligmosomoides polygyrus]
MPLFKRREGCSIHFLQETKRRFKGIMTMRHPCFPKKSYPEKRETPWYYYHVIAVGNRYNIAVGNGLNYMPNVSVIVFVIVVFSYRMTDSVLVCEGLSVIAALFTRLAEYRVTLGFVVTVNFVDDEEEVFWLCVLVFVFIEFYSVHKLCVFVDCVLFIDIETEICKMVCNL